MIKTSTISLNKKYFLYLLISHNGFWTGVEYELYTVADSGCLRAGATKRAPQVCKTHQCEESHDTFIQKRGTFTTFCPLKGQPRRHFIMFYQLWGHPRGYFHSIFLNMRPCCPPVAVQPGQNWRTIRWGHSSCSWYIMGDELD